MTLDLQNVTSHRLSAVPLALFYPISDMRKISQTKLFTEVEITEYLQLALLGYQYTSATVTDFMTTIQTTDFCKFGRFSNIADGITYKITLSF